MLWEQIPTGEPSPTPLDGEDRYRALDVSEARELYRALEGLERRSRIAWGIALGRTRRGYAMAAFALGLVVGALGTWWGLR